jgi:hypothetical protein
MCIIIHKPVGIAIPEWLTTDALAYLEWINDDGMGIMWPNGKQVCTIKSVGKFEDWWPTAKSIWERTDVPVSIHFRMATHGKVSKEMAHPVLLRGRKIGLMHNGVLSGYERAHDASDTFLFAMKYLNPLEGAWWRNHGVKLLVEDSIGSGNKMLVMTRSGETTIYNARQGTWKDGLWFSNSSFHEAAQSGGGKRQQRGKGYHRWWSYNKAADKMEAVDMTPRTPTYGPSYLNAVSDDIAAQYEIGDAAEPSEADAMTAAPLVSDVEELTFTPEVQNGSPVTRYLTAGGSVICPTCYEDTSLNRKGVVRIVAALSGLEPMAASGAVVCDWCTGTLNDPTEDDSTDATPVTKRSFTSLFKR